MKKKLKKPFKISILILISILLALVIFILSVYFSPSQYKNIPIGNRYTQINVNSSGINIFFPKDDTAFFYSHNFNNWQIITGVDTTGASLLGQNQNYSTTPALLSNSNSSSKPISENPAKIKTSPQVLHSKLLNLTFTTPQNVEASLQTSYEGSLETISYRTAFPGDNYTMNIYISDYSEHGNADYCDDTKADSSYGKFVMLGNRIELGFPATDRDYRKSWVKDIAYKNLKDKKICINIMQEKSETSEPIFDEILKSAKLEN